MSIDDDELAMMEVMDRVRRDEARTENKYIDASQTSVGSSNGNPMYKIGKDGRWDLSD